MHTRGTREAYEEKIHHFQMFFCHFRPSERMHKHAVAGQNTQQLLK